MAQAKEKVIAQPIHLSSRSFLMFDILATGIFFVYNFHHREHKEKNIISVNFSDFVAKYIFVLYTFGNAQERIT